MNKFKKQLARIGAAAALMGASASTAYAQTAIMPSQPTGAVGGDVEIKDIISLASTYLLSIAGGLAVLFLVIGGVLYTTAGGSDEKVQKARKYMMNAIIGLVVVVLAFVIVANTLKVTYRLDSGGSGQVTVTAPASPTIAAGSNMDVTFTCSATCPAGLTATVTAGSLAVGPQGQPSTTSTAATMTLSGTNAIVNVTRNAGTGGQIQVMGGGITVVPLSILP